MSENPYVRMERIRALLALELQDIGVPKCFNLTMYKYETPEGQSCEVTRTTDSRVFKSPLSRWTYVEATLMKSHFGRIEML